MLGFLLHTAVDAVVSGSVSTIISYQSGMLNMDLNPVINYVNDKTDAVLARKKK